MGIKLKSSESKDLYISTSFCVSTVCCLYTKGDKMPTLTLSIPEELKKRMDSMPEINWPEVLRSRLKKRAEQLLKFEEMRERGEL